MRTAYLREGAAAWGALVTLCMCVRACVRVCARILNSKRDGGKGSVPVAILVDLLRSLVPKLLPPVSCLIIHTICICMQFTLSRARY
jgi:hypothetical protein